MELCGRLSPPCLEPRIPTLWAITSFHPQQQFQWQAKRMHLFPEMRVTFPATQPARLLTLNWASHLNQTLVVQRIFQRKARFLGFGFCCCLQWLK